MSFLKDLEDGEVAEEEFGEFLAGRDWKWGRNTSTTVIERRFYDLWAQKLPPTKAARKKNRPVVTFEVKFDRRVKETGNVYFEHETLNNSRADFIVYKLDSDSKFYIQDRVYILNLIELPDFKQVTGGDKWGPGTIVPEEQFRKHFTDVEKAFA